MMVKSIKTPEKLFEFLSEVYKRGFEDGANADVDPNIHYMAIKRGVRYECGNCGAQLFLDEQEEEAVEDE